MKQLIIMLCAVAIGFCAEAATVNWSTGDIIGTNGELADDNDYDMGWTYTALFSIYADNDGVKGDQIGESIVGVNNYGNFSGSIDGLATGTKYWIEALITETTDKDVVTQMLVGPSSFTTLESESFSATLDFTSGTGFTGSTSPMGAASWGNVPEPTSGLLMLVGLGALGLRRKRA